MCIQLRGKREIVRMVEMQVDPLDPPKFKHKRIPRANVNGSPLMHSPPRPVTVKDQEAWRIPQCISNWKNPKGYTIPLDKRLAADGTRGLQQVQINDNFVKLSEALYVGEEKAREAVTMRSKVQKKIMVKEKEKKEEELRVLAQKARSERAAEGGHSGKGMMREKIRERRLEAKDGGMGKKRKITRDMSEKVALGMASACGGEVMYDQRLFNQENGMASGFGNGDEYNVYDKRLFATTLSTLYRRPKTDKGFTGCGHERSGSTVEFVDEEADPFGLDRVFTQVNGSGNCKCWDRIKVSAVGMGLKS
ncbi:hypothetical protein LXL04_004268 [Taraxacum kok-saghyz]